MYLNMHQTNLLFFPSPRMCRAERSEMFFFKKNLRAKLSLLKTRPVGLHKKNLDERSCAGCKSFLQKRSNQRSAKRWFYRTSRFSVSLLRSEGKSSNALCILLQGSLWLPLVPFAALCGPLRPFAALCGPLRPFAALCGPLRPFAALCGHLRPFAALCGPLRPFAALCALCGSCSLRPFAALGGPWRPFAA